MMSKTRQRASQVNVGIKGLLIIVLIVGLCFAYFLVPQFKTWIQLTVFPMLGGIGTTLGNVWTVFVDYVVPTRTAMWRLVLIGIGVGVGLGYFIWIKGYLGFAKWGRQQTDEISGVTPISVIQHSTPTPPPRPVEVKEEQT